MYDVIVVGGGPAGSQTAGRLAGKGRKILVLERKDSQNKPICCTGIISQECARTFTIDGNVVSRRVNSASVFSPSGELLKLQRQQTQACIVDRTALNQALASRAQDNGAEYISNSEVVNIKVGSNDVVVEAMCCGAVQLFQARAAVIATGFNSKLVENLGLGKVGDFIMGAQAEVETKRLDEVEVYLGQQIAPAFFAWLVPTLPGKALAGLLSRRQPGHYLRKLLDSLLAQGKIISAKVEVNYGGVSLRPLAKSYSDRIIVVGTAAGQVKPTTGGGIYYGMICADIAADTLHQALQSDLLTAGDLAAYEREWKKKLGNELKIGYWARRFYERLSDAQIERIFDIIKSNGIDKALLEAEELSFDWHGSVVLKLIGYRVLSRSIKRTKLPLLSKENA